MARVGSGEPDAIPGVRKAAILMVMIGHEASSAGSFGEMDEDEVQEISREIAHVQTLSSHETEGILEEFYQMSAAHDYVAKGGIEYARKILNNAFGPEQARKIFDRLMKTMGTDTLNFDALQKTDPQQLAKFIHNEHPQTIALILSHLNPSQAAGLLSCPSSSAPTWPSGWRVSIRSLRKLFRRSRR